MLLKLFKALIANSASRMSDFSNYNIFGNMHIHRGIQGVIFKSKKIKLGDIHLIDLTDLRLTRSRMTC